jgi:hypothetical protein
MRIPVRFSSSPSEWIAGSKPTFQALSRELSSKAVLALENKQWLEMLEISKSNDVQKQYLMEWLIREGIRYSIRTEGNIRTETLLELQQAEPQESIPFALLSNILESEFEIVKKHAQPGEPRSILFERKFAKLLSISKKFVYQDIHFFEQLEGNQQSVRYLFDQLASAKVNAEIRTLFPPQTEVGQNELQSRAEVLEERISKEFGGSGLKVKIHCHYAPNRYIRKTFPHDRFGYLAFYGPSEPLYFQIGHGIGLWNQQTVSSQSSISPTEKVNLSESSTKAKLVHTISVG